MSWVQYLLGNRYNFCSCGRKMKSSKKPTEFEQNNYDVTSIPGFVIKKNSSRGAKHGPFERRRMYHQANKMLMKARQKKARTPPNDTCTMVRMRIVRNLVVSHRVERKRHNAMWKNCLGETFLRRNKSWENSKFEALESHAKQRKTSASTRSTTWLCSSEMRMQKIARWAPGKDPARLQNHF